MTIDPQNITNFNRTNEELELFFLFCIFVANKNSSVTALKVNSMAEEMAEQFGKNSSPFRYINQMVKYGKITGWLEKWKIGQYKRFTETMKQIAQTFVIEGRYLENCSVADLQDIKGVGMKTARFFALHSRPTCTLAVLDTHVLKWLKEIYDTTHTSTPSNYQDYKLLEGLFLGECYKWQKSAVEMDTFIWKYYSNDKS